MKKPIKIRTYALLVALLCSIAGVFSEAAAADRFNELEIRGNEQFTSESIYSSLRQRGRLLFEKEGVFRRRVVEEIRASYLHAGYADVRVEMVEGQMIGHYVLISEGAHWLSGQIQIDADREFNSEALKQFLIKTQETGDKKSIWNTGEDVSFHPLTLANTSESIVRWMYQEGHGRPELQLEIKKNGDGTADLHIILTQIEVPVETASIVVLGNIYNTSADIISASGLQIGERIHAEEIVAAWRRLLDTACLVDASVARKKEDPKTIEITVSENVNFPKISEEMDELTKLFAGARTKLMKAWDKKNVLVTASVVLGEDSRLAFELAPGTYLSTQLFTEDQLSLSLLQYGHTIELQHANGYWVTHGAHFKTVLSVALKVSERAEKFSDLRLNLSASTGTPHGVVFALNLAPAFMRGLKIVSVEHGQQEGVPVVKTTLAKTESTHLYFEDGILTKLHVVAEGEVGISVLFRYDEATNVPVQESRGKKHQHIIGFLHAAGPNLLQLAQLINPDLGLGVITDVGDVGLKHKQVLQWYASCMQLASILVPKREGGKSTEQAVAKTFPQSPQKFKEHKMSIKKAIAGIAMILYDFAQHETPEGHWLREVPLGAYCVLNGYKDYYDRLRRLSVNPNCGPIGSLLLAKCLKLIGHPAAQVFQELSIKRTTAIDFSNEIAPLLQRIKARWLEEWDVIKAAPAWKDVPLIVPAEKRDEFRIEIQQLVQENAEDAFDHGIELIWKHLVKRAVEESAK